MTFDQRLSATTFAQLNVVGFGPEILFDVVYNATDVTLTVAAVPEPETWAMLAAGLGVLGWRARRRRALVL